MTELLTAAQMRAIEQAAIASGKVTGLELMERAGCGVVEAIFEEWPELADAPMREGAEGPDRSDSGKRKAVVLCGPGNNGGDGFVVARLLHERGWQVDVFLYGDPDKLPPDAKANYERWSTIGATGINSQSSPFWENPEAWSRDDLLIDALFGTGLSRPLPEWVGLWSSQTGWEETGMERQGIYPPRCVSVDMPSGICSDSGRSIAHAPHKLEDLFQGKNLREKDASAIQADLTVTFHRAKVGHCLVDRFGSIGKIAVKDIGLEGGLWLRGADGGGPAVAPGAAVKLVGVPDHRVFKPGPHKFSNGHALVLSGGAGKTGAARLAARGALRIGAGLVTLGVPPSAQMEVAAQITALMLTRVADEEALAEVLSDTRLTALCLGPGMGQARARDLVPTALRAKRRLVLDADALSAFADEPEALFAQLHDTCVLTPHGGEFSRLFPDIAANLSAPATRGPAYSKVDATRDAARRAGCVVLFKGPDTVIAAPDGRCVVHAATNERAAPWLATAGSGDVLAGFITGLLARKFAPMQAAEAAVWLHVECARKFGPGLIAEDLPEQLPAVFREIGF